MYILKVANNKIRAIFVFFETILFFSQVIYNKDKLRITATVFRNAESSWLSIINYLKKK